MEISCDRAFLPGTSLEPAVIPTAQASSFTLQYFHIMCDVPSVAVFCSESIKCFYVILLLILLLLHIYGPKCNLINPVIDQN